MTIEFVPPSIHELGAALAQAEAQYEVLEARRAEVGRIRGLAYRALMWSQRSEILRLGEEYEDAEYLHYSGEHPAIAFAD